jgi:TRAP-type uncharacterized transport system substrate-binding protein
MQYEALTRQGQVVNLPIDAGPGNTESTDRVTKSGGRIGISDFFLNEPVPANLGGLPGRVLFIVMITRKPTTRIELSLGSLAGLNTGCMSGIRGVGSKRLRALFRSYMKISKTNFIFLALAFAAGCENNQTELWLITPASNSDKEIVAELVDMLDHQSAIRVSMSASDAADEAAIEALMAGEADIALVSNNMPFHPDIATVLPLYPTVLHIGYREGRNAASGGELIRDANVYAGQPGSASRLMFEHIVLRLGMTDEDFVYVTDLTTVPDVFVLFAAVSSRHAEKLSGYQLLSLGLPDDIGRGSIIDTATTLNPQLRPYILPTGIYGDATPGPVVTVAVDMLLVARSDLSESMVYDFVHELVRLRPALASLRPGLFENLTGDFNSNSSTFILHPGLVAYIDRDEPSVLERYSGVAEVTVTVIIALFSASFAGVRIFRMRRKNRIDAFYTEIIAIRQDLELNSTEPMRVAATSKIRALQNKAFAMLVDEKLAADESFRIFVSLSNDVLGEIAALQENNTVGRQG